MKVIRVHNIQPENIHHMNEKGFVLEETMKIKVICHRGRKNPRCTQDRNRELVTFI